MLAVISQGARLESVCLQPRPRRGTHPCFAKDGPYVAGCSYLHSDPGGKAAGQAVHKQALCRSKPVELQLPSSDMLMLSRCQTHICGRPYLGHLLPSSTLAGDDGGWRLRLLPSALWQLEWLCRHHHVLLWCLHGQSTDRCDQQSRFFTTGKVGNTALLKYAEEGRQACHAAAFHSSRAV